MRKAWRFPMFLSGVVLLSQAFPLPAPVRDAATAQWVNGYTLHFPQWYVVFAPFCGLSDLLTRLSLHQAELTLAYIALFSLLFLGTKRALCFLSMFIVFLAWVVLIHHPMARLVAADPNILLIDFHSHSCVSHDGRPSFTAEKNMQWHAEQGYNASFITDHNRVESSQKAKAISRADWQQTGYRSLEGEEASLYKTHLVILGTHEKIDNRPYDSDPKKIPLFIADMHKKNIPVIASIPEYWLYHWYDSTFGNVDDFIRWGIDGFEIINSAPKALDFPPAYRRHIVDLCRANNLPMTGISDNHGWGYATAAWNAMRLPGWQQLDPDQLEDVVLKTLKTRRFEAVTVLERARYNPENVWQLLITPFADLVLYWRSLTLPLCLSWLAWVWAISVTRWKVCLNRS